MSERDSVMTGPSSPASCPAARALATTKSGSPSRSPSPSSIRQPASSASRFCVKAVLRSASRAMIARIRASASPLSAAPARTKARRVSSNSRASSGVRASLSRACHNVSIRAYSALLPYSSDDHAARRGANSRCNSCRAGLLSAPATVKNTDSTRSSARPESSSASTVLAKPGGSGLSAIAATSSRARPSAASKAGAKSASPISSKGARPKGLFHSASSGLVISVSLLAADRAIGAAGERDLAALAVERVVDQHLAPERRARPGDDLDGLGSHHRPHYAGQRPQHPRLGTGRREARRGCLGKDAFIARRTVRGVKHAHLPLPLRQSPGNQRVAVQSCGGIGEVAGLEIVGTIEDQVILGKQFGRDLAREPPLVGAYHDIGVLRLHRLHGRLHF